LVDNYNNSRRVNTTDSGKDGWISRQLTRLWMRLADIGRVYFTGTSDLEQLKGKGVRQVNEGNKSFYPLIL
jgi:hypothetical protein